MIEPKPELAHLRVDGLGGEKVVTQVHVLRVIPVIRGHVGHRMALVIGRVVDQHRDGTQSRPRLRDRRLERGDVGTSQRRNSAASPAPFSAAARASPSSRWTSTKATRA